MTRLTGSAIEDFAIKLFERLGYDYVHAPDIAPDGDTPEQVQDRVRSCNHAFCLHIGQLFWFGLGCIKPSGTPLYAVYSLTAGDQSLAARQLRVGCERL